MFDLYTIAIATSSAVIGFIAGRLLSIRKESIMANSADKLAVIIAAATAKIADLEVQLAKPSPEADDLAADESAITAAVSSLQAAGVTLPPEPAEATAAAT